MDNYELSKLLDKLDEISRTLDSINSKLSTGVFDASVAELLEAISKKIDHFK